MIFHFFICQDAYSFNFFFFQLLPTKNVLLTCIVFPTIFSQSSEKKGMDRWCAQLYIANRDRDRSRMRPWIGLFARRWGLVLRSVETQRGFFLLLLRTSACPSSFSFSRDFAFRRHETARENTYNAYPYLNASHDIPLFRVSNGIAHNSRVSGVAYGYPDIKVVPRSSTRPW